MGRGPAILLIVAGLCGAAAADPAAPGAGSAAPADPIAAPAAPLPPATLTHTPWIDLAPSSALDHALAEPPREYHPVAAAIAVGGLYAVFTGWTYLAWYRKHKPLSQYKFGGDGWLGDRTYAGGADKFGHAWATMSLGRLGAEVLRQYGGYGRTTSALIGAGLSEALFLGVEVKDGFYYEFSFSDATGDTLGALAAFALSNWPRLDELFDYRVQYFPSTMYLRKLEGTSPCPVGGCSRWNIAEDYSGETYLLAFHLGGIHALRDMKYGTLSRFVDVVGGFGTRNYKPTPDKDITGKPTQELFIGVSLNAQGLFDWLLEGHRSRSARTTRKVTHALFEVFNLPYTAVPVIENDHMASGPPAMDGA